jgi:hypothetical protein
MTPTELIQALERIKPLEISDPDYVNNGLTEYAMKRWQFAKRQIYNMKTKTA